MIESAFNVVSGPLIRREHLPEQLTQPIPRFGNQMERGSVQGIEDYIVGRLGNKNLNGIMDDFEKDLLDAAIRLSGGNKLQASQLLGISRQWLYRKLQKYTHKEDNSG